jgi:hypothetical protein
MAHSKNHFRTGLIYVFWEEQYDSTFIIAFARGNVHSLFASSNPPSLIAPTFQASEQLGVYGDSGFDSLECNILDTNQWICCMKPKKRAGSGQDAKERSHPVSAFRLGRAFFFA